MRDKPSAELLLSTYRVVKDIYLLGNLSSGVTVYKQQVRAHNLAYALATKLKDKGTLARIAVIGGGISGLTLTAGLLSLLPDVEVTILEKRWDLCPIQQGAETRWLHPHIYDWPAEGSRAPSADLPLLNWVEGTAADVAHVVLRGFSDVCGWAFKSSAAGMQQRLRIYLGAGHVSIDAQTQQVEWLGQAGTIEGGFVTLKESSGSTEAFDAIVIASGFGVEANDEAGQTPSYWRNDTYAQPILSGGRRVYVISGYGDGAIVDLCRLTIERFQQGRVLQDFLGTDAARIEAALRSDSFLTEPFSEFLVLSEHMQSLMDRMVRGIRPRLRKDVLVVLHGPGKNGSNRTVSDLAGGKSSFLNKVLLFSLFRCGAFVPSFEPFDRAVHEFCVPETNHIVRHGPRTKANVLRLFKGPDVVSSRLDVIEQKDEQSSEQLWPPGSFPYIPRSQR